MILCDYKNTTLAGIPQDLIRLILADTNRLAFTRYVQTFCIFAVRLLRRRWNKSLSILGLLRNSTTPCPNALFIEHFR